jgi:hypothetical protein
MKGNAVNLIAVPFLIGSVPLALSVIIGNRFLKSYRESNKFVFWGGITASAFAGWTVSNMIMARYTESELFNAEWDEDDESYECSWCGKEVKKGDKFYFIDGAWTTDALCVSCKEEGDDEDYEWGDLNIEEGSFEAESYSAEIGWVKTPAKGQHKAYMTRNRNAWRKSKIGTAMIDHISGGQSPIVDVIIYPAFGEEPKDKEYDYDLFAVAENGHWRHIVSADLGYVEPTNANFSADSKWVKTPAKGQHKAYMTRNRNAWRKSKIGTMIDHISQSPIVDVIIYPAFGEEPKDKEYDYDLFAVAENGHWRHIVRADLGYVEPTNANFSADSKFKEPYMKGGKLDMKRGNDGKFRRRLVVPLEKNQ